MICARSRTSCCARMRVPCWLPALAAALISCGPEEKGRWCRMGFLIGNEAWCCAYSAARGLARSRQAVLPWAEHPTLAHLDQLLLLPLQCGNFPAAHHRMRSMPVLTLLLWLHHGTVAGGARRTGGPSPRTHTAAAHRSMSRELRLMSRWLLRATSRGVGSFLNSLQWQAPNQR